MDLHGAVGGLAAQAVCPVVAHRDAVGERALDLLLGELVHFPRRLADQQSQHLGLRGEFDEGKLDRLVLGERPAERLSLARIFHALVDAVDGGAERARGLADAVLMHETLREREPAADLAELRILRHEYVSKTDARMVGRHVEGPHVFLDPDARALRRHQETGDAARIAVVARGAREQRAMGGDVHARGPHLLAVDDPALDVVARRRHRARLHVGRVRAVMRLGETKGDAVPALDRAVDHRLLVVAAVAVEHGHNRKIADDGMLVLEVVVQPETFGGEMLADHRHPEVGTILAAILPRHREAQVTGRICKILRLAEQRFPFMPRQAAILEIGARPFAAMVEEADVVVGLFQRLDLARDEAVELSEIGDEIGRQ
jgi:hypothetical protein